MLRTANELFERCRSEERFNFTKVNKIYEFSDSKLVEDSQNAQVTSNANLINDTYEVIILVQKYNDK